MKDISLNKNGQISLICFLAVLVIQLIFILLIKCGVVAITLSYSVYVCILLLLLLGTSLFFGIKQLRKIKFTLFWVIPVFVYFLFFLFALFNYYSAEKRVIYPRKRMLYTPKRKIGVFLNRLPKGEIQINAVFYKSKAALAGLQGGDIITQINGEIISGKAVVDVAKLIRSANDGKLEMEVERNGKKKIFSIDMTVNKKILILKP